LTILKNLVYHDKMIAFNKIYFIIFLILFVVEVGIAIFLKDGFLRHTFGDFLVVLLLYCFLKSFINVKPLPLSLVVWCIAFLIEILQLTPLLIWLDLQDNYIAKTVLGNSFSMLDLVAYTFGILFLLIIEFIFNTKKNKSLT